MAWDTEAHVNAEFDGRRQRRTGILESIHGIDGLVAGQVATRLYAGLAPGELPNYDSTTWNHATRNDILAIINNGYRLDNPLNPLRGIDPATLDQTSRELIENHYLSAKNALIASVGTSANFGEDMRHQQDEGRKKADQEIRETAATGYNRALHGDAVVAALTGRHDLDAAKFNADVLKRVFPQVAGYEIAREANADLVYRLAPR